MSDTQGDRPEDRTSSAADDATPTPAVPSSNPDAAVTPSAPAAPPAPQAATPSSAPSAPQQATPYVAPQHPGAPAPQGGARPVPPAAPAGWPAPGPQYTGPYAGQPQQPAYPGRPTYAGQPAPAHPGQPAPSHPGQSFGLPTGAQPTLVIPEDTAAPRKKSNAGKVVGLIVAAALVGGAAGLGGTYAGLSLWGGSDAVPAASPQTITVNNPDDVNATTAIAAKVVPSVVTISASGGG